MCLQSENPKNGSVFFSSSTNLKERGFSVESSLVLLARASCAQIPCTCLRVPSLCLALCLHLVDMLNCSHDHWEETPPLNHGRAASTLTIGEKTIGEKKSLVWLTLFSPLIFC